MKPNLSGVTKIVKGIQRGVSKHAPEILTGIGILGMVGTTILAVKATPKALQLLEEKKKEEKKEKLTPKEIVQTTWKCYAPAASTAVMSVACLVGADSVQIKRSAALTAAYKLSETAFSEYKAKVIETLGEKTHKEIREAVTKDKVDKAKLDTSTIIVGSGNTLCYDVVFGQEFESNIDTINRALNNLNFRMLSENYISLNEFYSELGHKGIGIGDDLGWNLSKHGQIEVTYGTMLTQNNRPCITIEYNVAPEYEYNKYW